MWSWRRLLVLAAACALALMALAPAAGAARKPAKRKPKPPPGPALTVPKAQLAGALRCPGGTGANPKRPIVLLVHGTGTTGEESWPDGLGVVLDNAGFDWCMVTIPGRELGDIQTTSEYVVAAVRALRKAAPKRKVSLIGHSQGADLIRWPVRWWPDVRAAVDDLITIEGANQGVLAASGVCSVGRCAPALWQYRIGSSFLAALNRVPTPAGPSYTAIGSQTDELIAPGLDTPTSTYRIPGTGATDVQVQALCPGRVVTHVQAIFDAAELAIVMDALRNKGPAQLARIPRSVCGQVFAPGIDPTVAAGEIPALYAAAAGPTLLESKVQVTSEPPLRAYAR
jgi:triacylglycerol lipase